MSEQPCGEKTRVLSNMSLYKLQKLDSYCECTKAQYTTTDHKCRTIWLPHLLLQPM